MNWPYLGLSAFLPLILALGVALLCGALASLRLHQQGGSSRSAFRRLLLTLGISFAFTFLVFFLWEECRTVIGVLGVAVGRGSDQRIMGILRAYGQGFLSVDRAKAAGWYQKAAESGDAQAQVLLARCLAEGTGVPKDLGAALRWSEASAALGEPQGMLLAGDLNFPKSQAIANAWYHQALLASVAQARRGDGEGALTCGRIYLKGKGVQADKVQGLAWLLLAEQLGLAPMRVMAVKAEMADATPDQRMQARERMQTIHLVAAEARPTPP